MYLNLKTSCNMLRWKTQEYARGLWTLIINLNL